MSKKRSISKRVQELLTTATPKQKALLICKQRTDRLTMGDEPLLTEEEEIAVRTSLKTQDERTEFNKWIDAYNVYCEFTPLFGLVYKEYQVEAEMMLGYLRQWEDYNQEENHLIAIYESLRETSEEAAKAFLSSLPSLTFKDAKVVIAEDGYPEIDVSRLYKRIQAQLIEVRDAYDVAKAIVVVMEEYTKRTRSKDFRPDILEESIKNIKNDYALRVAPRYSREVLRQKKEKGLKVTADEIRRAVYPSYEEITPSERNLNLFRDRLNAIVKRYER